MTLNRENYKFMPLGVNNKIQRSSVEEEKDFSLVNHKMAVIYRWDTTMGKANSVTGFIMQSFFNRGEELILPLSRVLFQNIVRGSGYPYSRNLQFN